MAKSKLLLMVGIVVAILALVVCGVMVGREMANLGKNQKKLKSLGKKVEEFCQADPYPSPENVAVQTKNVELIQAKLDDMMALLAGANFEVPEATAAGFVDRLDKVRKDLIKASETSGTRVPASFAFGFERWADGASLPKPEQLDELNRQLSVASVLCGILFEEGCVELTKVIREEVPEPVVVSEEDEEAAEAVAEEDDEVEAPKFNRIRFTMEFVAREQQLFRILNRLASDPMFLVVSSIAMTKDVPDVRMPVFSSEDESAGSQGAGVSPTDRIMVSGPSIDGGMRLTMMIDACHFPGVTPVAVAEPDAESAETPEKEP